MINRKFFFDHAKTNLFDGKMTQSQVNGLTAILDEWEAHYSHEDDRWLAYMLATAHHETDRKMQPIEEYGKGKGLPYGKRVKINGKPYNDTTAIFYGRGLPQLTWYDNYQKAGNKLGIDLLQRPELALNLKYAVQIMFLGMIEGWFTTRKLSQYFSGKTELWVKARAIINGSDKAALVASYAIKYYACISHTV